MATAPVWERSIDVAEFRVIFAGGGTGGHLFPAIAIAEEIKKSNPDAVVQFVGTKDKIEARIVPQKGFGFNTIWISGFHRRLRFSNFIFPLKVLVSLMQSYSIIKNIKPDVVVGTGGYVSGPFVYVASLMNIPTLIHEQNSYPGVTTRLLGSRVNKVCITFEQSKKYLKRHDNVTLSGNPTRASLDGVNIHEACSYFGFDSSSKHKTVLVFGGSLGAATLNQALLYHLDSLIQQNIRIIWQTGNEDIERVKSASRKCASTMVWVNAFIDKMEYAYAAADLVICRAGATTIAELTRLGKPAMLIPYPYAAADHQTENAKAMTESGAALLIKDSEAKSKLLEMMLEVLNDSKKLDEMSRCSKKLGKPGAASEIAKSVLALKRTGTRA